MMYLKFLKILKKILAAKQEKQEQILEKWTIQGDKNFYWHNAIFMIIYTQARKELKLNIDNIITSDFIGTLKEW